MPGKHVPDKWRRTSLDKRDFGPGKLKSEKELKSFKVNGNHILVNEAEIPCQDAHRHTESMILHQPSLRRLTGGKNQSEYTASISQMGIWGLVGMLDARDGQ